MKKILRVILFSICIVLFGILLFINISIYSGPDLKNQNSINKDIILQLNFLEHKLKDEGLARKMQIIYPEGYFFSYVLYGLTWSELANNLTNDSLLLERALSEAKYAYNKIDSDSGKLIFSPELNPQYGIFYQGWKNYLLGKMLSAQTIINEKDLAEFTFNCEQISNAFIESESPYLESYPASSWPIDAFLAIASLQIYDDIVSVKYKAVITDWIEKVKSKLDPETGLIPHLTDNETGETIEGVRGSSISLILRILTEIDPEFAVQQFELYYKYFKLSILGFPAIREYPKGKSGFGDIDSGPVIFDIGFSGTIVSIGTLKSFGEFRTANLLSSTIETFGFPVTSDNKKKYLFEKLPIADAFISWSRISNTKDEIIEIKGTDTYRIGSKFLIHFYSITIFLILLFILYWKKIFSFLKQKSKIAHSD